MVKRRKATGLVNNCCKVINRDLEGRCKCDDPAGRHLGRSGPTNPPQREQCGRTEGTVLRTGPGVQRPEAPTTSKKELGSLQRLTTPSTVQLTAWPQLRGTPPSTVDQARYEVPLS